MGLRSGPETAGKFNGRSRARGRSGLVFSMSCAFHPGPAWLWSAAQIGGPREVGQAAGKSQAPPRFGIKESIALMNLRLFRLAPLGALLLLLGCSTKISICPVPAILADTQSVTIFRPGTTPDLANELYTVALVDATGDC